MQNVYTSVLIEELAFDLNLSKSHVFKIITDYTHYLLEQLDSDSTSSTFLGILDFKIDEESVKTHHTTGYSAKIIAERTELPYNLALSVLLQYRKTIITEIMNGSEVILHNLCKIRISPLSGRLNIFISRRFLARGINCTTKATPFLKLMVEQEKPNGG